MVIESLLFLYTTLLAPAPVAQTDLLPCYLRSWENEMQELFTRAEVAKMIQNMLRLEKSGKGFDAWSETVYDDNGGFIMDSLLDMGEIVVPDDVR